MKTTAANIMRDSFQTRKCPNAVKTSPIKPCADGAVMHKPSQHTNTVDRATLRFLLSDHFTFSPCCPLEVSEQHVEELQTKYFKHQWRPQRVLISYNNNNNNKKRRFFLPVCFITGVGT